MIPTKLTKKHSNFTTKSSYLIIHITQNQALQVGSSNRQIKQQQLQVSAISQSNSKQLWIIDQVEHGMVQIVNAYTDKVIWANQNHNLIVKKGNGDKKHYWILEQLNNNIRISNAKFNHMYLTYNPSTKRPYLKKNAIDQWQLRKVTKNQNLNKTCFIYQPKNLLFIDVPSSTAQQLTPIIVWKPNYRFNQRWQLLKAGQVYIIKSLITGLNLDVYQQQYQQNQKIIQYNSTGGTNQFWMLEKLQNHQDNQYRIYCFAEPEYQLGHNMKMLKIYKGRKFVWRIEGYIPE